jgi:hypothetical protein
MNFVGVAMGAQIVDVSVGFWELGNLFASLDFHGREFA